MTKQKAHMLRLKRASAPRNELGFVERDILARDQSLLYINL